MTTKADWIALAERCEKATGPDRDIERCMCSLIPDGFQTIPFSGFTSSLDDITALIERELPSAWVWTLGQNIHHRTWGCSVNNIDDDGVPYSVCWGASKHTPALALCAAFCRAMAEKEPT